MAPHPATFRVGSRFQGPSGQGQGGWTAAQFAERIATPVSIALRAPIPLETELRVVAHGDRWHLVRDDDARDAAPIMIAERWDGALPDTGPISIGEARDARRRFADRVDEHPAADCFSCGAHPGAMGVNASPLPDGRYATDWSVPGWAARADGSVEPGVLWAALDCTAAWWVALSEGYRTALTAQLTVEVIEPIAAGETYALVGWNGHGAVGWDGRKRRAASAAFDRSGRCVARSTSFWLSVDAA